MLLRSRAWRRLLAYPRLDLLSRPLSISVLRNKAQGTAKASHGEPKNVSDDLDGDDPKIPNRLPKAMRVKLAKVCFKMRDWGKTGKVNEQEHFFLLPSVDQHNPDVLDLIFGMKYDGHVCMRA